LLEFKYLINRLSEIDETELSRISNIDSISSSTEEDQSLRITIKFLNETQKIILANSNDTISKIKR
jgi:multidrug efflux pump subunit AcrB